MAIPRVVVAPTSSDMETLILRYIASGFTITSRVPTETVLVKKKAFSIPMLIIGLLLCFIPLFIYLIVYALQKDEIVVIRLADQSSTLPTSTGGGVVAVEQLQWSDDRLRWHNGTEWVDVASELPPSSALSDDKRQWWDGTAWRVVQPGTRHPKLSDR